MAAKLLSTNICGLLEIILAENTILNRRLHFKNLTSHRQKNSRADLYHEIFSAIGS